MQPQDTAHPKRLLGLPRGFHDLLAVGAGKCVAGVDRYGFQPREDKGEVGAAFRSRRVPRHVIVEIRRLVESTLLAGACEEIREKVGVLMFEFSRFWPSDYGQGRDFVADLDAFLGRLPKGWPYAIEMRNQHWLRGEYFGCLAKHGVAHVFNSWEAMPPVKDQIALSGSRTNPKLVAARFLLKPGRRYEEAVKAFQPCDKPREVNQEARQAGAALLQEGTTTPNRQTYIYVNNHLEGNALATIEAMASAIG